MRKIGKSILIILDDARKYVKDKYMLELLLKYQFEISQYVGQAGAVPSSKRRLKTIRNKIVDICVYDVEGILLGQFTEKNSHYMRFWKVYQEMKNIKYDPSRNVVMNPALRHHFDNTNQKIAQIDHPYTYRTLEVFNASYETMPC